MASLFSTPKSTPQVIYLPASQTEPSATPAASSSATSAATSAAGAGSPAAATPGTATAAGSAGSLPEDTAAARIALLQRRQRGRTGTVATAWTGIMTPRAALPQRKQLLGE